MMTTITLLVVSYFLGAIPSGYIITKRLKGFDIRSKGSGNPGAANVYRVVGKWPGIATFFCDALKGASVVALVKYFAPAAEYLPMLCGFVAICGHMWTIFLKFKGGKGVATSCGVFGALLPIPTAIALACFGIVVWRTGRISPGSILAAIVLPACSYFVGGYPLQYSVLATVIGLIVIYKHIPNIKRMLNKSELAFEDGSKKKDENK
ncbi:MAG: glycerol-3-phosphate 1-O-acyltransferase PlsY [Elusimicrobiota bacterium]|jgi:glycerol-3-phosphate acyltransferase PlsY|nr:glycerol-3-phosphate 1-O-acyltransferase PlsY [Elusimicrobiota bacterium]